MNILVTGGCGFIGSHIARRLARDNNVFIIDDLSSGSKDNLDRDSLGSFKPVNIADVIEESIVDYYTIDIAMDKWKIDTVIHLAAQPSLQASIENPKYDATVNIVGALNLIKASLRYGVKRFLFASTSAVYQVKHSGIYLECDEVEPVCPYGISKAAAERYIAISGLSYSILRLGNVYGPKQKPLGENQLIPRVLAHIYQGEDFKINGDGTQTRDFIFVDDVANAFIKAINVEHIGLYNVATGNPTSVLDVLDIIKGLTKFKQPFIHSDAKLGELHDVRLPSYAAQRILKWKPETSLVIGLKKTIDAWPK